MYEKSILFENGLFFYRMFDEVGDWSKPNAAIYLII
jgi:hypothetical protein